MRLTQDFRSQLYGPWEIAQGYLVEQFDHLIAQIIASYGKQHNADDTHGDITATSLIVTGQTILGQGLAINATAEIFIQMDGSQNDYNPAGFQTASIVHLYTAGLLFNLTGLQAPSDPTMARIVIFVPGNAITTIIFKNQSTSSLPNNRFDLGGVDYTFSKYPLALIWDTTPTIRQWRPLFRGD